MVDRREIDEMARLRAILSGESVPPPAVGPTPGRATSNVVPLSFAPPGAMVSAAEREQMARLRDIMSGGADRSARPVSLEGVEPPMRSPRPVALEGYDMVPSADPMEDILAKFYASADAVAQDALVDRPLRRAMATEKTPSGARVGNWEIAVTEGDRKTYGVRSIATGEEIASDLCLYEAAQALAEMLNEGAKINTPEVREILSLEEQYARHLADAVQFRRSLRSGKSQTSKAVLEDRFENSRMKAAQALSRLRRIVEGR